MFQVQSDKVAFAKKKFQRSEQGLNFKCKVLGYKISVYIRSEDLISASILCGGFVSGKERNKLFFVWERISTKV